jgi:type IV pilus assembly protein PilM
MLKSKSFLGVDFGAGSLKIAEFEAADEGGLKLLRFGIKPLGLAGSQEAAREGAVKKALGELLTEAGFVGRNANLCAPGFQVFSKFVKLPPVDTSKVTQIIQYEAQQNVPFPLAESAWDYQILGASGDGGLEVLLVAIKSEIVEKLFAIGESVALKMDVVDGAIAALANAFRFNYGDVEGCSLLIDIGAKTSNVLLFEKNKFYVRTVPVGANLITQEFAAESKMPFAKAEEFKLAMAFVSLGGAYEEPDDPHVAAISKVSRNVLTRLHLQVNQTVQFYRTQQGGSAPARVYMCGGGSIMPYAAEFFQEKLNVPVEYFNPFRNVALDPGVDVAQLEKVASCFGEVVGLGLRNIAQCPVELNLMPKSSRSRQEFNAKKPYLLAAVYALAVGVFASGLFYARVADAKQEALEKVKQQIAPLAAFDTTLSSEEATLKTLKGQVDQLGFWIRDRVYWNQILAELRQILKSTEDTTRQRLGVAGVGVWIDALLSTEPTVKNEEEEQDRPRYFMMDPVMMRRYGLIPRNTVLPGENGDAGASADGGAAAPKPKVAANTNELAVINLTIRAVNLQSVKAQANNDLAYELQRGVQSSPLFDEKESQLSGTLEQVDENAVTFSFPLRIKLKRPIKL